MNEGEIDVIGGETGRVSAFYDSNNHLNIIGGGSLQASAITLVSDSTVTGNSTAAGRFGISNLAVATTKFTGQPINAATNNGSFNVNFNGTTIAVTLAANGSISHTPNAAGFSATFNITSGTTGRLTLAHTLATGPPLYQGHRRPLATQHRLSCVISAASTRQHNGYGSHGPPATPNMQTIVLSLCMCLCKWVAYE